MGELLDWYPYLCSGPVALSIWTMAVANHQHVKQDIALSLLFKKIIKLLWKVTILDIGAVWLLQEKNHFYETTL